jgi:hypothetical protein
MRTGFVGQAVCASAAVNRAGIAQSDRTARRRDMTRPRAGRGISRLERLGCMSGISLVPLSQQSHGSIRAS